MTGSCSLQTSLITYTQGHTANKSYSRETHPSAHTVPSFVSVRRDAEPTRLAGMPGEEWFPCQQRPKDRLGPWVGSFAAGGHTQPPCLPLCSFRSKGHQVFLHPAHGKSSSISCYPSRTAYTARRERLATASHMTRISQPTSPPTKPFPLTSSQGLSSTCRGYLKHVTTAWPDIPQWPPFLSTYNPP